MSKNLRSGLGILPNNQLVFIYSDKPVTFKEFSQMFVNYGCVTALYLDGGSLYSGYAYQNEKIGMNDGAMKIQFFYQN